MGATGQKCSAMDHTQPPVARGDETRFLRKLAARALHGILAVVERPGGHLPGRDVPCVPPLPDEHRIAVVEVGHDKGRIGILDHRIHRFGAVWEADQVVAQHEASGRASRRGSGDGEGPAARWVSEPGYRRTIEATAAAAAATCRGSGP